MGALFPGVWVWVQLTLLWTTAKPPACGCPHPLSIRKTENTSKDGAEQVCHCPLSQCGALAGGAWVWTRASMAVLGFLAAVNLLRVV